MKSAGQLRIVFSNNTLSFSPRPKKSSETSLKRSGSRGSTSPFLATMRELESVSPVYARVLERLARQMIERTIADVQTE